MEIRRVLHLAGRNALLCIVALALIGLAGEAWLRWTTPFPKQYPPLVFVPGVGLLLRPDSEVRWTNGLDFWAVSRTNRLGFLDREPPSPERAAKGCHIAVIGDSFVEAKEVPIPSKFHVRLEELTARELPGLDVTTSAFGMSGTGQINQLAFYDAYVRPLRPKLVVLVFVKNDFRDNFPLWDSKQLGVMPDHMPHVTAARAEDGSFRLRPPDPHWRRFVFSPPKSQWETVGRARGAFWFLQWLHELQYTVLQYDARDQIARWLELSSLYPAHAPLLDHWASTPREDLQRIAGFSGILSVRGGRGGDNPSFYAEALAFTAFGLDEFRERATRDGAALVILASHTMSHSTGRFLALLEELAAERGIPVIDQGGFIRGQGAELRDAHWRHDLHWNPTGHQWAAEALLEYLKRNRASCNYRPPPGAPTWGRSAPRLSVRGAWGRDDLQQSPARTP